MPRARAGRFCCKRQGRPVQGPARPAEWTSCLKGPPKRPTCFANEVMRFKKNSHYLPRFQTSCPKGLCPDLMPRLESSLNQENHVRNTSREQRLPKNPASLFFLEAERGAVQRKKVARFLGLVMDGRSFPGLDPWEAPESARGSTWKQMCAGRALPRSGGRKIWKKNCLGSGAQASPGCGRVIQALPPCSHGLSLCLF